MGSWTLFLVVLLNFKFWLCFFTEKLPNILFLSSVTGSRYFIAYFSGATISWVIDVTIRPIQVDRIKNK